MRKSFVVAATLSAGSLMFVACSSSSGLSLGDDDIGPPADGGSDATIGQDSAVPSDAAIADSGPDTGIPSCVGITYCEDFESYEDGGAAIGNNQTLGPWKTSVSGRAVMKVDTVKPFSGLRSLHITTPEGDDAGANGTLHQAAATGGLVTGNDMFGRAMVYYGNDGANGLPNGHTWVFQSQGKSTVEDAGVSMNAANQGTNYFLNYHSAFNPEQSVSGGAPLAGQWLCMQWEYNGSGAVPVDEGKIWINGVVVVDSKTQTPNWDFATPWTNFDFGFTHYAPLTKAMDIYLDDFALDSKMIPCPPM